MKEKIYGEGDLVPYEIQKKEHFNGIEFLEKYKLIVKPTNDPASPEYQFSCEISLHEKTGRVNQVIIRNMGPKT